MESARLPENSPEKAPEKHQNPFDYLAIGAGTVLMGASGFIAAPVVAVVVFVGGTAAVISGAAAPYLEPVLQRRKHARLLVELIAKIRTGDVEAVKKLLNENKNEIALNEVVEDGKLTVNIALISHKFKIVDALLAHSASLEAIDGQEYSPLTRMVAVRNQPAVEYLLSKGVDVNQPDTKGRTALALALIEGNLPLAKYLSQVGAKYVNQIENGATSPLVAAGLLGQPAVFEFLLQNGVNINQPDNGGLTALHGVVGSVNLSPLERSKIVHFLLAHGANPNVPQDKGKTPLMLARELAEDELVAIFEHQDEGEAAEEKVIDEVQQQKVQALNDKIRVIREIGHVMGLSSKIEIIRDDNARAIAISTEGMQAFEAAKLFAFTVQEYVDKALTPKSEQVKNSFAVLKTLHRFEAIEDAAEEEVNYLSRIVPIEAGAKNLFERYHTGQITLLPCVWVGHEPSIALYKDYLIYANRGEGYDASGGVRVFKLTPAQRLKITPDWIMRLFPKGNKRSRKEIERAIFEVVDLKKPLTALRSKPQRHGTCAFVNRKSLIEGILYVFERENLENAFKYNKENIQPGREQLEAQPDEAAHAYATLEYKQFTTKMRDFEVRRRVSELRALKKEAPSLKKIYHHLFVEILEAHHGQWKEGSRTQKKVTLELKRAQKILAGIEIGPRKALLSRLQQQGIDLFSIALENKAFDLLKLTLESDPAWVQRFIKISQFGDRAMIGKLISQGLPLNRADAGGKNLLHTVLVYHDMDLAAFLYEAGARLPMPNENFGYSLLTQAAFQNDKNVIEFLLTQKHDINELDQAGRNVLSVALERNNIALANTLWDLGARSPAVVGKLNYSFLTWAAYKGDLAVLQFLADKNVDMTLTDGKGRTALEVAKQHGNDDCVEFIKRAMAKAEHQIEMRGRAVLQDLANRSNLQAPPMSEAAFSFRQAPLLAKAREKEESNRDKENLPKAQAEDSAKPRLRVVKPTRFNQPPTPPKRGLSPKSPRHR